MQRLRDLTKYCTTRDAISLGTLVGGVLPMVYGLAIIFIPSLIVGILQGFGTILFGIFAVAGIVQGIYTIVLGTIAALFFGILGGLILGFIPGTVIGGITGVIVDFILAITLEKLIERKAALVGVLTSLSIALVANLILINSVFHWFRTSSSFETCFILFGLPSLIYIIASGKTSHFLYTKKLETFMPHRISTLVKSEPESNIYTPAYIKSLFDEMSGSYDIVNSITSFGFSRRWRKQCVEQIMLKGGMKAYDLMTGMGEGWVYIGKGIGQGGKIVAMDISPNMLKHARAQREKLAQYDIEIIEGDVLENGFADNSADCVISLFGVKALSDEQKAKFAYEINRILKPDGQYSLIEVSVPGNLLLRGLYMFYLKYGIPLIGKLALGNPENYHMLGIYTEKFQNSHLLRNFLSAAGLNANYVEYFFGCATGVWGRKPGGLQTA